jgi:histidinol-phosphate aminotransferase
VKFPPPADPPGALRLHYNENTAGCSRAVIEAIGRLTPHDVATYPEYGETLERVGRWLGVPARRVMLTNGLDEGLLIAAQYAAWHADEPSDARTGNAPEFVIPEPAFEVFADFADLVRARIVRVRPDPSLAFPLDRVLAALTPATRAVYLIDPNNPTGLPLPPGAAETIADAAPHALVLVDEAYADYSGRTLIGPALDRHANLVVGRTFAKGHGLAGLRVGALVAADATMDRLRELQPFFNVNVVAIRALEAALDDGAFLTTSVGEAARSRQLVFDFCERRGLEFWRSAGNFVLLRIGPAVGDVTRQLAARGILARDKSAAPGCQGCLRVTTGTVADTERFLTALEDILASRPN